MHIWPDCIPCTLKMSIIIARIAGKDEEKIRRFYEEILKLDYFKGSNWNITSPEIIRDVWLIMHKIFGVKDPLKKLKNEQNRTAIKIYPYAREIISNSPDPFFESLKFSIAGNSIDIMTGSTKKPAKKILKMLQSSPLDPKEAEILKERLVGAKSLIYLCDNCGEIVFDKLLVETILKLYDINVTFVTRSIPVLNDATMEDAFSTGMDKVASVIENGTLEPVPGTMLDNVSSELIRLIDGADLIISKGGGNYDLLSEENRLKGKCTFLLQAKCAPYCIIHNARPEGLIIKNF